MMIYVSCSNGFATTLQLAVVRELMRPTTTCSFASMIWYLLIALEKSDEPHPIFFIGKFSDERVNYHYLPILSRLV